MTELVSLQLDDVSCRPAVGAALAINSVSVQVEAASVVAVVGPNGAGKSTLLRLLAGLIEPTRGAVWCSDQEPYPTDLRTRARLVHYVPTNLDPVFDFTVRQTVAMGRYPHRGRSGALTGTDRRHIDTALEQTELEAFAERSVLSLSSGELRRVWLARALVSEARFLLLDEPTANLDLAHALALSHLARRLADAGHGVVVAIHDLEAAYRMADRVLLLNNGRVHASGAPSEVLTDDNISAVFSVCFEHDRNATNGVAVRRTVVNR